MLSTAPRRHAGPARSQSRGLLHIAAAAAAVAILLSRNAVGFASPSPGRPQVLGLNRPREIRVSAHAFGAGPGRGRRIGDFDISLPLPRPIHDPSAAGDWEEGGGVHTGSRDEGLPRWFLELSSISGFEPDLSFYSKFIVEAAKKGDLRAAQRWLQNAEGAGVSPDGDTLKLLFQTATKAGELASAARYAVKAAAHSGAEPSSAELTELLSRAAAEGNLAAAEILFEQLGNNNRSVFEKVGVRSGE
ncbi:unnamed protein product, partial [Polarella glacialis]